MNFHRPPLDERVESSQTAAMGVFERAIAGAAMLATGSIAQADDQPICAARPGKSSPACTVPAGHFQIETGLIDWTRDKNGDERDTSLVIGETTFKYGLTDRSDVEVDVTPWQRSTSKIGALRDHTSGIGDVTVGYKQQLTPSDGPVQLAVLPVVKIPTARHSLGNGKWEAGVLLPIGYSIAGTVLSLGLTPEVDWVADTDSHGHHAAMVQVVSIGLAASSKLSLTGELWGQWDWDPAGTGKQASADGSIAYLVSDSVQLDGGANFGLNRQTPDVEVYTGISARF